MSIKVENAVKTLTELDGFISLNKWMEGAEVHMRVKGMKELHRGQLVKREFVENSDHPYRYSFHIGEVKFFAMSARESDYFEAVVKNQRSNI